MKPRAFSSVRGLPRSLLISATSVAACVHSGFLVSMVVVVTRGVIGDCVLTLCPVALRSVFSLSCFCSSSSGKHKVSYYNVRFIKHRNAVNKLMY